MPALLDLSTKFETFYEADHQKTIENLKASYSFDYIGEQRIELKKDPLDYFRNLGKSNQESQVSAN